MSEPLDPLQLAKDVMGLEKLLHVINYLACTGRYLSSEPLLSDRMREFRHLPFAVHSYVYDNSYDHLSYSYSRRFTEAA